VNILLIRVIEGGMLKFYSIFVKQYLVVSN
jgi:hypothetical protein